MNSSHSNNSLSTKLNFKLNEKKLLYKRLNTLLDAYSSSNVLKRGYSLIIQDGKVVKSKKKLKDDIFEVKFHDGSIKAIETRRNSR